MADTTIRLEFKDDTPPEQQQPAQQAPTQPTPPLVPLAAPQAKPVGAPISAVEYEAAKGVERAILDAGIAQGQFLLQAPVKAPPVQEVGDFDKRAAQGERETREKESQDRLARKIGRAIIDAEVPLAEQVDTPDSRRQGERDARDKEAQDARDRAHVLRHIEQTIPLAQKVEEQGPINPLEKWEPLLRQIGFGGVSKLAGKFFGFGKKPSATGEAGGEAAEGGEAAAGAEAGGAAGLGIGTIGLAVAAVAKVLQVGADTLRIGMKAQSDTVVELAGNNYMGAFNKQVEGAADTMRQIPVVGGALASGLELAVQPVRSFTDVVSSFVERGKELSKYSGPLASANAQADVRAIMSDLREANELGPELAQLTTLQSEAWAEIRELAIPIKRAVCEILVAHMEAIVQALHGANITAGVAMEVNRGIQQQLKDTFSLDVTGTQRLTDLAAMLQAIYDRWNGKQKDPVGDFTKWFESAYMEGPTKPVHPMPNVPILPTL